jgi:hypothetical protein
MITLRKIFLICLIVFVLAPVVVEAFQDEFGLTGAVMASDAPLRISPNRADNIAKGSWWDLQDWNRGQKVAALNLASAGLVAAIGVSQWHQGDASYRFHDEGWFAHGTDYGGADKIGHAWTGYTLTSAYRAIYKNWGYQDREALLMGAASSGLAMTLVEVGDGFSSKWGFCWEDEVMNLVGVGMSYLRHSYPALENRVDFRLEWLPSASARHGEHADWLTDYSGQRYLLAFKLNGFLKTDSPVLRALELHLGYYTRGYLSNEDEVRFKGKHRYGYVGMGLNITYLLQELTGHRAAGIFNYIQVPYTSLPFPAR